MNYSVFNYGGGYDVFASKTDRFLTHCKTIEDVIRYAIGGNYTPDEITVRGEDGDTLKLAWSVKVEVYKTVETLVDVVEF